MRTETFEDLCSVVVKQREEIKALREQLQKITRELDEAITEDRAAREDAVKRAEADRVRIERLREERDQFRAKLEAATGADHTVPAAVPQHGVIGKTVRHSTGRVGRVMSVKTDWVDGHGWTLYAVQRSDGVAGSQIWHASNCTIVEERPAKEPEPRKHPVPVGGWVRRTAEPGSLFQSKYQIGTIGMVERISADGDYDVRIAGQALTVCWVRNNCEPCDPPEGAA